MFRLFNYRTTRLFFSMVLWLALFAWPIDAYPVVNDDYIIVLDQSGSMREKVPGKPGSYVADPRQAKKSSGALEAIDYVVKDLLKKGDYFVLITFGNAANVILSQQVTYGHERDLLKRRTYQITFKDKYTDIMAGINEATELLSALQTPQRRKIMVMITDGINEPPTDSQYADLIFQEAFLEQLRENIHLNKWNLTFVGIGKNTEGNIQKIVKKLNLPPDKGIVIKDPRNSKEIRERLQNIFKKQRESKVEAETKNIKLQLRPNFFGGYGQENLSLKLTSFFSEHINISLDPEVPIRIGDVDGVNITCSPTTVSIAPDQTVDLNLSISFSGSRSEEGRLLGNYTFRFSETNTTPFYPHSGTLEVLLPSWWEVHGSFALAIVVFAAIFLAILRWLVRRTQVSEFRFIVTCDKGTLGEPMTLRRREHFSIANNQFVGHIVPASGLACQTAARVKYLGRKKFEANAVEAKILYDGKEFERMSINLNTSFDLRDENGKYLRFITISEPGKGGDIFGDRSDPF